MCKLSCSCHRISSRWLFIFSKATCCRFIANLFASKFNANKLALKREQVRLEILLYYFITFLIFHGILPPPRQARGRQDDNPLDPLNLRANFLQPPDNIFIPPINYFGFIDNSFAISQQAGNNQSGAGAQIKTFHFAANQRCRASN